MSDEKLNLILDELTLNCSDRGVYANVLHRAADMVLKYPALGAQVVARICATGKRGVQLRDLEALLGSALDLARMARENGNISGARLLEALEDAVRLADGQDKLAMSHRLIFARAWTSHGLTAPSVLETHGSADDARIAKSAEAMELDAVVAELFKALLEQAKDNAFELHTLLMEAFPAMPADLRDHIVLWSGDQSDPVHARLACFWLLSSDVKLRSMAVRGLAERLKRGALPETILAELVVLRSWLPQDKVRAGLDRLLRDAKRNDVAGSMPTTAWSVQCVLASLPDGGGAQSWAVALRSGRRNHIAMVLIKQGHGVKDAYVMSDLSASGRKAMLEQMRADLRAYEVGLEDFKLALSMAIDDGLAHGLPPAPGLIEVSDLCGLGAVRPQACDLDAVLEACPAFPRIAALSARERDALVKSTKDWVDETCLQMGWFDEGDGVHEALSSAPGARAGRAALWAWLETRRAWWARIIASSALVLDKVGHSHAQGVLATALALKQGVDLKRSPIMAEVCRLTYEAAQENSAEEEEEDELAPAPEPEKQGELSRIMKACTVTPDWLEGYLLAIIMAPKQVESYAWVQNLIDKVPGNFTPRDLQRFLDLAVMRGDKLFELAADPQAMRAYLDHKTKALQLDVLRGFRDCHHAFQTLWPVRSLTKPDREMLRLIADTAQAGGVLEIDALASWISDRNERSMRR